MMSISLSQIEYVLALDRLGSFSDAAEACYVTQSTLSTMIKKMEDQLDYKLFDRKSKPIKLTTEGAALIQQLRTIYHEFEVLEEIVQETKEELHGSLSIGVIPTLAPFLLPLFLEKLVSAYQNIKFYIHEITTNEIVKRIKSRELDVGLLSIPIVDKGLMQQSLFKEDFLIYDASAKKTKQKKKYKVADIDISRLWLLEESHCLTNQIGSICHLQKKRTINNNLVYNSGSFISLLELVNSNKGLTLLPKLAITSQKLINKGNLYPIESPSPAREIGMITHPNFAKKRILGVLENEIKKAVKPILGRAKNVVVINPF